VPVGATFAENGSARHEQLAIVVGVRDLPVVMLPAPSSHATVTRAVHVELERVDIDRLGRLPGSRRRCDQR
jgi:hypothetical protein